MKTLSLVAVLLFAIGCGSPNAGQKKRSPKFTAAQAAAIIIDA